MNPDIRWITAVYGRPESRGEERTHIAVPDSARSRLKEMADELLEGGGLVALYVPEGTDDVYEPDEKRGRVIGAVALVPMPETGRIEDYFYTDWDGSKRWPIGWPCQMIYVPPVGPKLRDDVESEYGQGAFRGYVQRLRQGPFRLEPSMQQRLNRYFAEFSVQTR